MSIKTNLAIIDKDLEDIFDMFLINKKKESEQLLDCLIKKDIKKIHEIAHKVAGNAGSYGLYQLSLISSELEEACISNNNQKITELVYDFSNFLNTLSYKFE